MSFRVVLAESVVATVGGVAGGAMYMTSVNNKVYVEGTGGSVTIIDTSNSYATSTIVFGSTPTYIYALNSKVYVSRFSNASVGVIDTANSNATSSITVGTNPKNITSIGNLLYVANRGSDNVTIIDTANGNSTTNITVGDGPEVVMALNNKIYVTNVLGNTVSVIDTQNGNSVENISVGTAPQALTYIGSKVYVANTNSNNITIIDTANSNATSTVSVGNSPVSFATIGSKVYVANTSDATVSIIDTANNNSVTTVSVGGSPDGLTAVNSKVYTANFASGTVSIIDTSNNNAVSSITVNYRPVSTFYLNSKLYVANTGSSTVSVIDIDTTFPTILSISSSKNNGTYGVGEIIPIDIIFSEAVTSTGNVTMTLETGTTDRTCEFSITSSSTATCNYTVQAGDTVSDLTVNSVSGTIRDAGSNLMSDFSIPSNIADTKNIIVDAFAAAPTVSSPSSNGVITSFPLSIAGTCESGSTVYITNSNMVNSPKTSPCISDTFLIDVSFGSGISGIQTLSVYQIDATGNTSSTTSKSIEIASSSGASGGSSGGGGGGGSGGGSGLVIIYGNPASNSITTNTQSGTNSGGPASNIIIKGDGVSSNAIIPQSLLGNFNGTNSGNSNTFTFVRNATVTVRNNEVLNLQKFLNANNFTVSNTGLGAVGNESNYFGLKTKQALAKFQKANGIKPANGFFGPITRAFINNLIKNAK